MWKITPPIGRAYSKYFVCASRECELSPLRRMNAPLVAEDDEMGFVSNFADSLRQEVEMTRDDSDDEEESIKQPSVLLQHLPSMSNLKCASADEYSTSSKLSGKMSFIRQQSLKFCGSADNISFRASRRVSSPSDHGHSSLKNPRDVLRTRMKSIQLDAADMAQFLQPSLLETDGNLPLRSPRPPADEVFPGIAIPRASANNMFPPLSKSSSLGSNPTTPRKGMFSSPGSNQIALPLAVSSSSSRPLITTSSSDVTAELYPGNDSSSHGILNNNNSPSFSTSRSSSQNKLSGLLSQQAAEGHPQVKTVWTGDVTPHRSPRSPRLVLPKLNLT